MTTTKNLRDSDAVEFLREEFYFTTNGKTDFLLLLFAIFLQEIPVFNLK